LPTVIEFMDIAGLVKGASTGAGLGNKFLANIREVDAILHVVRCFADDNIVHVEGRVNPVSDKEIIDYELQLKDLESIDKKIQKTERSAKAGDAKAKAQLAILQQYKTVLESGNSARTVKGIDPDAKFDAIGDLCLLTDKPVIYVANVDEKSIAAQTNEFVEALKANVEYNLTESGLDKLIRASYALLNLITYFTAGPKEVRAWTIQKGWKAPAAAGVIHSDFERGFIRAEVIKFADYQQYKSENACKEAGKLSVEGKEYTVIDGDIMHFRFNV
jgi:ribosome-binding ATPase